MKLTYDPKYNIAYLTLKDAHAPVTTISLSDEVNIDLAPDGTLYGIELLNASTQLAAGGGTIANAARNQSTGSTNPHQRRHAASAITNACK